MKRILLSVAGTVLGVVALLSFKSQGRPLAATGSLPSAALPATSTSARPAPTGSGPAAASNATSSSPPDPKVHLVAGDAVQTRYGIVQVQVTVTGARIDNVAFLQLTAFDDRSQQINSDAAPILLQETLAAQNAHVDSVSGASYTSDGYVRSLQSALDKVGIK